MRQFVIFGAGGLAGEVPRAVRAHKRGKFKCDVIRVH